MADELPYRAEYAKSGRASCKGCKTPIPKDTLRLAVMVQSAFHDGKQPNWFHSRCFFLKQRPKTVGDIADYASLRYEDQQKIQEKIDALGPSAVLPSTGKAKKRGKNVAGLKDFSIEYAKSKRAKCRGCEETINKDEVRISKTVFDTEIGQKYGGQALWHHVECFAKMRDELEFFASGDILPGFNSLSKEDQQSILKEIPEIKSEDIPLTKKMKLEPKDEVDKAEEKKIEKELKEQNKIMYNYRDLLKEHLTKANLTRLLEYNKQDVPVGEDRMLDRLCDIMTFGALARCEECKGGQYVFDLNGYLCHGDLTEWTKCKKLIKEPKRRPFKVPDDLKDEFSFLKKYKYKPGTRIIKYVAPSVSNSIIKKSEEEYKPKVVRSISVLKNMEFVILGKTKKSKEDFKRLIENKGGRLGTKIHANVTAVIASEKDVKKMGERMKKVKDFGIQVISEGCLDDIEGDTLAVITEKSICDWGTDPKSRMPMETEKRKKKSKYEKEMPAKMTITLKGGGAVDPDSGLQDVAHIYKKGSDKFNVVLAKTDIQSDKNSYYKLQLLEKDASHRYWVFRAWGRIGTTIGGTKLEDFGSDLASALENFYVVYEEKTGNQWSNRKDFKKVPGCFYPMDVDYGEEEAIQKLDSNEYAKSKLDQPIQDLIKLLFDVDNMKRAMLELELDMEKMPLGKLSKKQIESAYKVLTEISELIKAGETNERKFIDASNRFFTIIPHNFGIKKAPILCTVEELKTKIDMVESLMEIEIAYSLLKSEDGVKGGVSPIDIHYKQLKTDMTVLDRASEEFSLLEKYVQNTHAETHKQYDLEILQIFKVKREKEDRRYKPFKKLHNRKLLWHGSRFTNFVGILSQGLRIAPPEAPSTGYMFGKGIYFADMVSKSANYCFTNSNNPVGLMLLCEVALGDMLECKEAKYITKLPVDKHSCKGLGKTYPDDNMTHKRSDGVEIPLGKAITNDKLRSSLLYNEYIVYDIAQVNCQYLFQMKFNYKH